MPFLNDVELAKRVQDQNAPLATGVRIDAFDHKDSAIQPCTLDLTIGDIFLPEAAGTVAGAASQPLTRHTLKEGATAVVRTSETLQVPADIGAIAFPPAHLSVQGLLMTNPGHVDPGYKGNMHFTVINLGSDEFELRRGDRIVRLLFFTLNDAAKVPYNKRQGRSAGSSMITDELLGRLSPDFLNVTRRSQDAASEVQRKADWWAKVLPFGAALLTAIVTAFAATAGIRFENAQKARALNERIARLEGRIGELGGDVNLDALETRVSTLEAKQQEAPAR